MLMPKIILVPTDYSKFADRALRQALDIAQEYNAKVFLLHVVPGEFRTIKDDYTDLSITEETLQTYEEKLISSARKKMEKQIAKLIGDRTVEVTQKVIIGNPEDDVVKFQQDNGIDLVVISSIGKSGISQYLVGNVARGVLKRSTCPVLLTK